MLNVLYRQCTVGNFALNALKTVNVFNWLPRSSFVIPCLNVSFTLTFTSNIEKLIISIIILHWLLGLCLYTPIKREATNGS